MNDIADEFAEGFRAFPPLTGDDIARLQQMAKDRPAGELEGMSVERARRSLQERISNSVPWALVKYINGIRLHFPLRELADAFAEYVQEYSCPSSSKEREQEGCNNGLYDAAVCGILEGSLPSLTREAPFPVKPLDFVVWLHGRFALVDRLGYTVRYVLYQDSLCPETERTTLGDAETCIDSKWDVFIAYNSVDLEMAKCIAQALKTRGIKPWFAEERVLPGRSFQARIQDAISNVKCAAILIGTNGFGPWQNLEVETFISETTKRSFPVIPVLLPGVVEMPEVPVFLGQFRYVRLTRLDDQESFEQLILAIQATT